MIICKFCAKPQIDVNFCDHCLSNDFINVNREYTIDQWSHWIKLTHNTRHDFYPWEFSEDGRIIRSNGISGIDGPKEQKRNGCKKNKIRR